MLEKFKKYVDDYGLENEEIKLKYNHSIRVMELSKKYAKILNFNDEQIYLATIIGLLHDIGRFEQIRKFNTFNDKKSFDHADYGEYLLFEEGLIKYFEVEEKYYEIIKKAIRNHNKLQVEPGLNKDELVFANLIRDVDKLDIMYIITVLKNEKLETTNDDISTSVLDDYDGEKSVKLENVKNKNDRIVFYFAFVFDINYVECLKELEQYINLIYDKLNYREKFDEPYEKVKKYIKERKI